MISGGKVVEAPVEEVGASAAEPEESRVFDSSTVKPEDFPCWGTYEAGNKECEECIYKDECMATQKK